MIIVINIHYNNSGYYLILEEYDNKYDKEEYIMDDDIAEFLGLSKEYYINQIIDKFNCKIKEHGIFFDDILTIRQARNWLEENIDSFLIAKKLGGL